MLRRIAIVSLASLFFSGCQPPTTDEEATNATAVVDGSPAELTQPNAPEPAVTGKLTIGDPAPAIAVTQWIKGEPLTGLPQGKVNVVEFWATWCGPCLRNMPHLSKLQDEYGDAINVIGFTREDADTVSSFMTMEQSAGKTWDEVLTYRIAIDDEAKTNTAYMQAAEQRGIPCAFIVGKDGFVEWIGHPAGMDEPLASIVDGSWNRSEALAARNNQQQAEEAMSAFGEQLNASMAAEDFDGAIALIDEFANDHEDMKLQLLMTRAMIQGEAKRYDEQTETFQLVINESPDNAGLLNQIAWQVATETEDGDLDFALRTALQASESSDHADPSILDTLARVHYEIGDLAAAVEWQTRAVEAGPDVAPLTVTLTKYQDELKAKATDRGSDRDSGDSGNGEEPDVGQDEEENAAEAREEDDHNDSDSDATDSDSDSDRDGEGEEGEGEGEL